MPAPFQPPVLSLRTLFCAAKPMRAPPGLVGAHTLGSPVTESIEEVLRRWAGGGRKRAAWNEKGKGNACVCSSKKRETDTDENFQPIPLASPAAGLDSKAANLDCAFCTGIGERLPVLPALSRFSLVPGLMTGPRT